ncbi:hypothetical protein DFH08DRAFT_808432 [Mycena albidolilacea]|uniref:Uncharacterized protein n=1 Tax=Mycena albidolilacea TaxID=1033008 RepID=A0AAD7A3G2_9AGAR|nr:hypothetical protein DFH08DRAFT_808432 [Mycena albidolilacea]
MLVGFFAGVKNQYKKEGYKYETGPAPESNGMPVELSGKAHEVQVALANIQCHQERAMDFTPVAAEFLFGRPGLALAQHGKADTVGHVVVDPAEAAATKYGQFTLGKPKNTTRPSSKAGKAMWKACSYSYKTLTPDDPSIRLLTQISLQLAASSNGNYSSPAPCLAAPFLAGLVAFLIPVNILMAVLTAVICATITGIYCILTVHPLRYLDSPYRTSLSGAFWVTFGSLRKWWDRRRNRVGQMSNKETIFEAIAQAAIEPLETRTARDGQALIWTVKSLSDELELEPFVEAIPATLWALGVRRDAYWAHFRALAINPEVALHDAKILEFSISAGVLIQWVHFQTLKSSLTEFLQQLTLWDGAVLHGHEPDLSPVTRLLVDLSWRPEYHFPFFDFISAYRYPPSQKCAAHMIPQLCQVINYILRTTQHNIWIGYLKHAAFELNTLPCYFRSTLDLIQRPVLPPPELRGTLELVLSTIVSHQLDDSSEDIDWMDDLLVELVPIWLNQHQSSDYPMAIPSSLIQYLLNRKSDAAVVKVVGTCLCEVLQRLSATASPTNYWEHPILLPETAVVPLSEVSHPDGNAAATAEGAHC